MKVTTADLPPHGYSSLRWKSLAKTQGPHACRHDTALHEVAQRLEPVAAQEDENDE
jgi:hypothetical protein